MNKKIDYSVDKSNLRQVILNFPAQLKWAVSNWRKFRLSKIFSNVILCGMGGSALPMEFVVNYLNNNPGIKLKNIPFFVHRNYELPATTTKNSLLIFCSYSGNTEETIGAYTKAIKAGLNGAVITSGGNLEKLAIKNNTALIKIPSPSIPPRYATGYIIGFLLSLLADNKIIKDVSKELVKTSEYLKRILSDGKMEKQGIELAKKLKNKIPLIYSSVNYKIAAKVWKIKLNENSKVPAFWNYIPELNHNELVGFSKPNTHRFFVLILRDNKDNKSILKIMDITAGLLKKQNIPFEFIEMTGNNFFDKVFSIMLLGDWISYYLALQQRVDPWAVDVINEFKKQLKKRINIHRNVYIHLTHLCLS